MGNLNKKGQDVGLTWQTILAFIVVLATIVVASLIAYYFVSHAPDTTGGILP